MTAPDPFEQFGNVAKLLEQMQPMLDMLNAVKASVVREVGCGETEAANLAVAIMAKSLFDEMRKPLQ